MATNQAARRPAPQHGIGNWMADLGNQVDEFRNQDLYAHVDHFGPQDIATIASIPASQLVVDMVDGWPDASRKPRLDWNSTTLLPFPSQ